MAFWGLRRNATGWTKAVQCMVEKRRVTSRDCVYTLYPPHIRVSVAAEQDIPAHGASDTAEPCMAQDPSYPAYVDSSIIIGQTGGFREDIEGFEGIEYMRCGPENGFFPDLSKVRCRGPRAES